MTRTLKKKKLADRFVPEKYKTYNDRQKKERGMKKIHKWIPVDEEARIINYIDRIVKKYKKDNA